MLQTNGMTRKNWEDFMNGIEKLLNEIGIGKDVSSSKLRNGVEKERLQEILDSITPEHEEITVHHYERNKGVTRLAAACVTHGVYVGTTDVIYNDGKWQHIQGKCSKWMLKILTKAYRVLLAEIQECFLDSLEEAISCRLNEEACNVCEYCQANNEANYIFFFSPLCDDCAAIVEEYRNNAVEIQIDDLCDACIAVAQRRADDNIAIKNIGEGLNVILTLTKKAFGEHVTATT